MLTVAELNSTKSMGPVLAIGVVVALVAMMTLLPALLVICGRWVFWPVRPPYGSAEPTAARPLGARRPRPSRSGPGSSGCVTARGPRRPGPGHAGPEVQRPDQRAVLPRHAPTRWSASQVLDQQLPGRRRRSPWSWSASPSAAPQLAVGASGRRPASPGWRRSAPADGPDLPVRDAHRGPGQPGRLRHHRRRSAPRCTPCPARTRRGRRDDRGQPGHQAGRDARPGGDHPAHPARRVPDPRRCCCGRSSRPVILIAHRGAVVLRGPGRQRAGVQPPVPLRRRGYLVPAVRVRVPGRPGHRLQHLPDDPGPGGGPAPRAAPRRADRPGRHRRA